MKLSRIFFCLIIAGLMISVAGVSDAQEATPKSGSQSKQAMQKKQAKAKKAKRKSFLESVKASVTDLTDDQQTKLEAMLKEAGESHKQIHKSNGTTWEMARKREEILDGLTGPYPERSEKASKEAGYNEKQMASLKDINKIYRDFRYKGMQVLTAEQQKKMPQQYQDEFKKLSEAAAKKAAKEEAMKKKAASSKK